MTGAFEPRSIFQDGIEAIPDEAVPSPFFSSSAFFFSRRLSFLLFLFSMGCVEAVDRPESVK